ncbi:MAG: hypothetical protein K2F87_02280 [Muribaculaceae bacterium]|nr:hypothetical protein [Muribaculaceae bacterium]
MAEFANKIPEDQKEECKALYDVAFIIGAINLLEKANVTIGASDIMPVRDET